MRDERMKDLMKKFKQREQELIRQSKKRHEEIKRNTQKKRLEIINEAEKRKRDLLRYNIEFQKKQEEKMREMQRRENNRINNLNRIMRNNNINTINNINQINRGQRSIDRGILVNILLANRLRRNNDNSNNIERNEINIESINDNLNNLRINEENKKIEELLQDFKLTEEILSKIENKQCLICLDDYQLNENVCYLPCFHLFHSDCIKSWVRKSNKCPLCKNIIKLE